MTSSSSGRDWYRAVWRWHLYAGLIIAPFLLVLAVTGAVYLFKPQIEQVLYADYYQVEPAGERMSATELFNRVQSEYPDAPVTRYRPGESADRSTEFRLMTEDGATTVFVDPYKGEIIGSQLNADRFMSQVELIHGELMIGTIGDRIVELVACWTIVLMATGLYLFWPRNGLQAQGTLYPRLTKGKRIFRRDLHVVPGFWVTAGLLFLVLTGLPWSGFWGANFQSIATNAGVGYPPSIWGGEAPTSNVKTEDVADVPWAAETLPVPNSAVAGYVPLSLDQVDTIAETVGMDPSYTISLPSTSDGVFTLSAYPDRAQDEATIHLDQYSGAVLADYRYDNYGIVGKAVALGVTLHKGTQFGLPNQLISLAICLGVILVVVSGVYLWYSRKPNAKSGAPSAPSRTKRNVFFVLLIGFGIVFPLVGLSLLVVATIDWLLVRRSTTLQRFLNAG
ncbi:PepSY domain-containing protein [Exiguobacterium sp. SH1S21]|uniref:PepSY-associated TM helix domain-containing protein n=1 Tax=Exiguobacterium sp. SH1S21 TaxID=2510953 RepID=UPI00103A31BF|nr:PepSY domain-containing protein [Exiguobacterium sp. SH1S21]TCI53767.1 PepSY domain-containing protein [Exiguobacterium sp. SH1S21]